jgi:dTDP-4-dehydrorhamnose reductase
MRIMITGHKGQLGHDCVDVLGESYEILGVDLEDLDITDPKAVEAMIHEFSPGVIVNCAAHTNVDGCETETDLACAVNVNGPENLASSAQKHGAWIIHISTDYVFDGRKRLPEPYVEDETPHPLSYYGETKLEGEHAILRTTEQYTIIRTAWLYGARGHNFLKTMLKLAIGNPEQEIKVVNDQYGSPTWSYSLALQISKVIEAGYTGICHATAEGYCSWYELARCFLEKMGVPHILVPCPGKEYPTPAVRPVNSILENRSLKEAGIHIMPDWRDGLEEYVSLFRDQLLLECQKQIKV